MKTVNDVIEMLRKYPLDTPVFECFDAAGNFYFPSPSVREGKLFDGRLAIVLTGEHVPGTNPLPESQRDIVELPAPPSGLKDSEYPKIVVEERDLP